MYSIFKPYIFSLDPEIAHDLAIKSLKFNVLPKSIFNVQGEEQLETNLLNERIPNPIGLAAGFDKSAEVYNSLFKLGYGFVEVGTITPKRQLGNTKPRVFRLEKDQALINRLGFNNHGSEIVSKRISDNLPSGFLGINIGPNKDTKNKDEDYFICLSRLSSFAGYITINISSPNTEGLRDLHDKSLLKPFLEKLVKFNNKLMNKRPLLLKISPDLNEEQIADIVILIKDLKLDGIIATNTTVSRDGASSEHKTQEGGMSGKLLTHKSNAIIKYLRKRLGDNFPIIGVGGIMNANDAIERLNSGADLIQLYTGFIYKGPSLIKEINKAIINQSN